MERLYWNRGYQIQTAETARTQANSLITNEIYESNERAIQAIYYATIAKDIHVFTATQKQIIEEIANQCPLAGGRAVYEARSLYAIYEPFVTFDNDALCIEANLNWRQAQQPINHLAQTTAFNIYPNPTRDEVNISLNVPSEVDLAVCIYNAMGQTVAYQIWKQSEAKIVIPTHNWKGGVYFITVMKESESMYQSKLIIIE